MKKNIFIILVMFTMFTLLVACNEDNSNKEKDSGDNTANNDMEEVEQDNDSDVTDDTEGSDDTDSSTDVFEVDTEDQLDLGVGDTGVFDTTLGTYEITLLSAKLEEDINDEPSELDGYIILEYKIKNTSQETQNVEDLIQSLEVTDSLEGSGFGDGTEYFDGFEKLSGELEPNEEIEGTFLTHVYNSEEYYFRKDPGNVAAGSSNQVIWTIKADEAK